MTATDPDPDLRRRFESLAVPHLDAAYNLARWLTGNSHDAQDVVQDAYLRALRYFAGFRGDRFRPWLLQIVRHTCYTWIRENRPAEVMSCDDDDAPWPEAMAPVADEPHSVALRNAERAQINQAITALPVVYREVLVLRELEDLPYLDIARIADIPVGTVMSRLARARGMLKQALASEQPPQLPEMRPQLRGVPKPPQSGVK